MIRPRYFKSLFVSVCCLILVVGLPIHGQSVSATIAPAKASTSSAKEAEPQLLPGVVVEGVEKNSEAEKAGLREGDVLLSWSRGEAHGTLETPVDFSLMQMEQAPRGQVILEGNRGWDRHSWTLHADIWDVKTRFNFPPNLLAEDIEAKRSLHLGKPQEAYELWYHAASRLLLSSVRAAFLIYIAKSLNEASQTRQADEAFRRSLESAEQDSRLGLFIYWNWAGSFWARGDTTNATKYCESAVVRAERSGPSFTLANLLRLCQSVAYSSGDLASAEKYSLKDEAEWEQLAPDSDGSLSNLIALGNIATARGGLTEAEGYFAKAAQRRNKTTGEFVKASLFIATGALAYKRGDFVRADRDLRRSLTIYEAMDTSRPDGYFWKAIGYDNLSLVAEARGDMRMAERYTYQAWQLEKQPSNSRASGSELPCQAVSLAIMCKLSDMAKINIKKHVPEWREKNIYK